MERKNIYIVIFVITTIIASCVAVYFAGVRNNEINELKQTVNNLTLQLENSNVEEKVENVENLDMTEQQALYIANDVYKKAYAVFETKGMELSNYFTKKAMAKFNDWRAVSSDSLYMTTIFSQTGKKIRPLSLVAYTNDKIIVTGQITNLEDGETSVKVDQYPYYLVIVKENGNWLIDSFE